MFEIPFAYTTVIGCIGSCLGIIYTVYKFKLERDKRKLYEQNVNELINIIGNNMITINELKHDLSVTKIYYDELNVMYNTNVQRSVEREKEMTAYLKQITDSINKLNKM